jgi:hypothetical protein
VPRHALAPLAGHAAAGNYLLKIQRRENHQPKETTMTELRRVDPRSLQSNPNNPRKTPVPQAMEAQLLASIKAVGMCIRIFSRLRGRTADHLWLGRGSLQKLAEAY